MKWYNLPYQAEKQTQSGQYMFLSGGYHSNPDGCPAWGSSEHRTARFIGDHMGDLVITYSDGALQRVPLVFGYTLWFKNVWWEPMPCAPFKTGDHALAADLRSALYLQGAYEGAAVCYLRIQLLDKNIAAVAIACAPDKEGAPEFNGFYLCPATPTEAPFNSDFFNEHTVHGYTVDTHGPHIPQHVAEALERINSALLTSEDGLLALPGPEPVNCGLQVDFTGEHARILNGIFHANAQNLMDRIDDEGFMHTSYTGAPSWRYDGFGPWIPNANSYCNDYYARDGGRALMTLIRLGREQDCLRSADYAQRCLMYFPNNQLTLLGMPVPGHFTMVINWPLFFHDKLTQAGWPTQYTLERFGEEYKNLGNQETDGHGLMMMAIYNIFKNSPDKAAFARKHMPYIEEAARYITWSLDNPAATLSKDGLLYGEGEASAGTSGYSMYCNVPCALGLQGYAEIAETAGQTETAAWIHQCAEDLKKAITENLTDGNQWRMFDFGYYHDCVPTFLSDIYGYDLRDMPKQWVEISKNTYEPDISRSRDLLYDGSGGLGYNTSMRLQNAMLLDQVEDYQRFLHHLLCICYAPGLPEPYLVPECCSYSDVLRAIRRQGDLANLVQMAEVLKCILMSMGISPLINGTLKLIPRLYKGMGYTVTDFPVENSVAKVSTQVQYPCNGAQAINVSLENDGSVRTLLVRFGPFTDTEAAQTETLSLRLNGQPVQPELYRAGTAWWCDALLDL